jgi:hypothetical protein
MITFRQVVRILEHEKIQPDTPLSIALFKDTDPDKVNVLIDDGVVYVTEKRL